MKLQEKPSKIYELSSEYMIDNTHEAFLKFMLNKRFKLLLNLIKCNDYKMSFFPFFTLFWLVHSSLAIVINFVKFVCFISLASVQIYIQVVPLCDCNNNVRKQVYMALNKVFLIQQVSKDVFILQRDQLFNLTRTLTKFRFFGYSCFTHKCSI